MQYLRWLIPDWLPVSRLHWIWMAITWTKCHSLCCTFRMLLLMRWPVSEQWSPSNIDLERRIQANVWHGCIIKSWKSMKMYIYLSIYLSVSMLTYIHPAKRHLDIYLVAHAVVSLVASLTSNTVTNKTTWRSRRRCLLLIIYRLKQWKQQKTKAFLLTGGIIRIGQIEITGERYLVV